MASYDDNDDGHRGDRRAQSAEAKDDFPIDEYITSRHEKETYVQLDATALSDHFRLFAIPAEELTAVEYVLTDEQRAKFMCPIAMSIMRAPVKTAGGSIYEHAVIYEWLRTHNTDPMTNLPLENKRLTYQPELANEIFYTLLDLGVSYSERDMRDIMDSAATCWNSFINRQTKLRDVNKEMISIITQKNNSKRLDRLHYEYYGKHP